RMPSLRRDRPSQWLGYMLAGPTQRALTASVLVALAIASGYPLLTGQVIPDRRSSSLPSAHVSVPADWGRAAAVLNSNELNAGSVLVPPIDDFYQMPYAFGYYGADT